MRSKDTGISSLFLEESKLSACKNTKRWLRVSNCSQIYSTLTVMGKHCFFYHKKGACIICKCHEGLAQEIIFLACESALCQFSENSSAVQPHDRPRGNCSAISATAHQKWTRVTEKSQRQTLSRTVFDNGQVHSTTHI